MNPLARIPNPFKQTIIKDAWETPLADVPEIHAQAFKTCCRAFENVRTSRQCDSVLLHGEAGSGKTHLLGRLQRHLTSPFSGEKKAQVDIGRCLFLYCRLQTNPRRLWQHLRKTFVEDLLHRFPDGTTQLQRLVACRFADGDRNKQRPSGKWLSWIRNPANRDHAGWKKTLLPWLGQEVGIDLSLQRVLYHLITGKHVLEAWAWLKGEDSLSEKAFVLLDVKPTEEGQTEDRAREVVLSLCRLASPRMPVAFCFDQIEALQTSRDDPESLFLFGQMGASLFNSSNNALLIACIQSSVLDLFKESVREADYDRIAQSEETLDALDKAQAYQLIRWRLDSQKELAELRAQYSQRPLWPFEPHDFDAAFSPTGTQSPRKIISFAGTLFDKIKLDGVVAEPEDSSAFLKKEFERRLVMSLQQDVTESDITLAHGLPLLTETLGGQWHTERQPDKDIDFLLSHEAKRIALSLCNHQNMRSLGARFKRLRDWQSRNREVRLVLIRDQRLPISKTAIVTRSHLQSLKEKGGVLAQPNVETLAALQALRSLLSDAKSGDLHHQGETLTPMTVQEWLFQNLDRSLMSFFGHIVEVSEDSSDADSDLMGALQEVLKRHRIITIEAAAKEVQQPVPLIEEAVRRHPGLVGWLQGPPPVLFDYKPAEILRSKERDEG